MKCWPLCYQKCSVLNTAGITDMVDAHFMNADSMLCVQKFAHAAQLSTVSAYTKALA